MRHIGSWAGAALLALAPAMAVAQPGAAAGAPMQPGAWGQGGWQAGGGAAPAYTPGAPAYAGQGYAAHGYAPQGDWHRDHADYRRLSPGRHVPAGYLDPRYVVVDWNAWGFAAPAPGMRWVRYFDDGLLIDARGRILDARYDVDWDRGYRHGTRADMRGAYAGGYGYAGPMPGNTTYRVGPDTVVTTTVVPAPPPVIVGGPAYGYGGGYYGGGASVVAVTPGVAVTTTTTTTDTETVYRTAAVRHVWHRPVVHHHYRPRCVHATSCPVLGS